MPFVKNKNEKDAFEIGFSNRLAADETITGSDVRVERAVLYEWEDASAAMVGNVMASFDAKTVQFTLFAQGEDVQWPGTYRVVATVDTSKGRTLVGVADLTVTE